MSPVTGGCSSSQNIFSETIFADIVLLFYGPLEGQLQYIFKAYREVLFLVCLQIGKVVARGVFVSYINHQSPYIFQESGGCIYSSMEAFFDAVS